MTIFIWYEVPKHMVFKTSTGKIKVSHLYLIKSVAAVSQAKPTQISHITYLKWRTTPEYIEVAAYSTFR